MILKRRVADLRRGSNNNILFFPHCELKSHFNLFLFSFSAREVLVDSSKLKRKKSGTVSVCIFTWHQEGKERIRGEKRKEKRKKEKKQQITDHASVSIRYSGDARDPCLLLRGYIRKSWLQPSAIKFEDFFLQRTAGVSPVALGPTSLSLFSAIQMPIPQRG